MARLIRLAAAVAIAATLAGCSGESTAPADDPSSEAIAPEESPAQGEAVANARDIYNEVLDTVTPEDWSNEPDNRYDDFNGEFSYAVVEMTGDDVPELLVSADTISGMNSVKVYTIRDGEAFSPRGLLIYGAASAGGGRASICSFDEGTQIVQAAWSSMDDVMPTEGYSIEGDELVKNGWAYDAQRQQDGTLTWPPDTEEISFTDSSDRSVLDSLGNDTAADEPASDGSGPQPTLEGQATNHAASAKGKKRSGDGPDPTLGRSAGSAGAAHQAGSKSAGQEEQESAGTSTDSGTLTGTVRVLTAPEVVQLPAQLQYSHGKTPNGEDERYRYAILILDSSQQMTARSSGDAGKPTTRTANMVLLGSEYPYDYEQGRGFNLDGQHITIEYDWKDCWFPSDTRLPLAEPSCPPRVVL